MPSLRQQSYRQDADLLKIYHQAHERAKYLYDIDEKMFGYQNVLNFCISSKQCVEQNSKKRNQVLFWTYSQIGDLFLQKNAAEEEIDNYLFAVQYFQHALEFAGSDIEVRQTLEKLSHLYHYLHDEEKYQQTLGRIVALFDNAMQKEAMLDMATFSKNLTQEAAFLENALALISQDNINFLKKCENKLNICDKLLRIYERLNNKKDAARIRSIKEEMQKNLN
ncbi:MAG: hypothetical protein J6X42_05145 [Alphaproteobacteria bacterium]|nr:hypothetical protein [Alphaproteobacteria bacterium]